MLIAKHCRGGFRLLSFFEASPKLRGDEKFMKEVLVVDATLYLCMPDSLKRDFELSILVFSGSPSAVEFNIVDSVAGGPIEDQVALTYSRVCHLLDRYNTFFASVLPGMSHSVAGSELALLALDQGEETSASHKQIVASLPVRDLRCVAVARTNIAKASRGSAQYKIHAQWETYFQSADRTQRRHPFAENDLLLSKSRLFPSLIPETA